MGPSRILNSGPHAYRLRTNASVDCRILVWSADGAAADDGGAWAKPGDPETRSATRVIRYVRNLFICSLMGYGKNRDPGLECGPTKDKGLYPEPCNATNGCSSPSS